MLCESQYMFGKYEGLAQTLFDAQELAQRN